MLLVFYTTPATALVRLTLDVGGAVYYSQGPTTANGRDDAHLFDLPDNTPDQGSLLHVEAEGYYPFDGRGILVPDGDMAAFEFDDIHLQPVVLPTLPDHPTPPNPADPLSVIQWVYDGGTGVTFDLLTKGSCGQFTEACALALFRDTKITWGHLLKVPGQNQWNGHAVDAIHQVAVGDHVGVWDIIQNSESPEARPVFNYAGPDDETMWAAPIPPATYTASSRRSR